MGLLKKIGDWSTKKKVLVGIGMFIVGFGVGFAIFWRFALKTPPITTASNTSSEPNLVRIGNINGFNGKVAINAIGSDEDKDFTLTIVNASYPVNATRPISLNFVSVRSTDNTTFTVDDVENLAVPYTLEDGFNPDFFDFGFFKDANGAPLGNVALAAPGGDTTPTVLTAKLGTQSAQTVEGTIALSNRISLVNGEIVETPQLQFRDIVVPDAPDVFLYLSKDGTFSGDTDLKILINRSEADGRFTVNGDFDQDLGRDINLKDYENGSFILWCMRFSMLMGDGSITASGGMEAPPALVLTSKLVTQSGKTVEGTLTLKNRVSLENGVVVDTPQIQFRDIVVPDAPDVFLYLSKDGTYSGDTDLKILINQSKADGRFTVNGDFVQDLGHDINLKDYENGSFILWCMRFSVLMGDGAIVSNE